MLNGERTLFLSGAVHYPRVTPAMWPALASASKKLGVNMVELYAFWSVHEPVAGELLWEGNANVSAFIQVFADAGLFVTLRIGPYVCAETDNGGLPPWLGFVPGLRYRECNQPWLDASRYWFRTVVSQLRPHFAANGGPVVLVQVENELDGASDAYVEWCSAMAHEELERALSPAGIPVVIMSTPSDFGQAAYDTISTCNAADCVAGRFLETHGRNGRVGVDQPLLITELEGGFQVWVRLFAVRASAPLALRPPVSRLARGSRCQTSHLTFTAAHRKTLPTLWHGGSPGAAVSPTTT